MSLAKSFCRLCHAFCGIDVKLEDGRPVEVRGDRANPMSEGFTCIKGRCLPEQHAHEARLCRSQKREASGDFAPIGFDAATDEIAAALRGIIDRHGPRAVAVYAGTAAYQNAAGLAVARAFTAGLGSPSFYSSLTIDQPAKLVAPQRHGTFMSGTQRFETADVWMVIGCNSLVSMYGGVTRFPSFNPTKRIREAKARGLDLIVVDPRKTELARMADLHLQPRPGEDPTLVAGMLRVILEEGLHDVDFCQQYASGVDDLKNAVDEFSLDYVAARTGVAEEQIAEAARRFARGPRGVASTGTGPSMAPHPNLTEHLVMDLNTICGRYNREGDPVLNPGTLMPSLPSTMGVMPPLRPFPGGERCRIRGLETVAGEMPTAALAEEILTPGEGQVRALIVFGGNPIVAFPDQAKTLRALRDLELLVVVDPSLSSTAQLADYVIAPTLCLERADVTLLMDSWYPEAYAMYTPAVAAPPAGVIEDWAFLWELARRLETRILLPGGPLDMARRPTTDDVLRNITAHARIAFDELRAHPSGSLFPPDDPIAVGPGDPASPHRLALAPEILLEELRAVRAEPAVDGAGYLPGEQFSHRLIARRLREVCNSVGQDFPTLRAKRPYNPVFMNPEDLAVLGVESGDLVEIESADGCIQGIAEAAPDVLRGVVSMSHSWGGLPDPDASPPERAGATSALIDTERIYDPVSGIPRMSAIPVNVRPLP
ncbi:MAG: molybdopterin-dependent oxidoreductase [Myxococcota bacterium]|jgi:anaerobic selenocysteine-containing dehydrogenase|nr:molybdopterin-dependent oxidoreductase [Myxococcota bacterium]